MKDSKGYREKVSYLKMQLRFGENFDILSNEIMMGGHKAYYFTIDGFSKDEVLQKLLQYFMDMKEEKLQGNIQDVMTTAMPYIELETSTDLDGVTEQVFSGMFALVIEGFDEIILLDTRTYPVRSVSEPDKDKSLRGSKDGFVETIVFNTAMIRRRIRSTKLRYDMLRMASESKTDIVVAYMDDRVDKKLLELIKKRIQTTQVEALTVNQQSLAECLYKGSWFNPFPKFRYTERPDTAAAQLMEGNIIILVDNAPQAMIIPTGLFDLMEETDDYCFPPITGTYLRITRLLIVIITYILTPTFLLLVLNDTWIPQSFEFIKLKETQNIPVFWQFIVLELAIDGLRLAAVNTPNMLSTPLSIMAALVLGEFSVKSGWFNAEVMLYMAFVAVANYTQPNYELGYALKFMRIATLVLTTLFSIYGYIAGILLFIALLTFNKTLGNRRYLYPLIPLNLNLLMKRLTRRKLRSSSK